MHPLSDDIAAVIEKWPEAAQLKFAALRETLHDVAAHAEVGEVTEALKWGQPSWLPAKPRVGSTLRCGWHASEPKKFNLYVHCQTTLAETMRSLYPQAFEYDGQRALRMALEDPAPAEAIEHCALLTLTYHRKSA
ncbi:DUF1801 domain-containing protein [uncultured Roseobacter sp.]|uniref:DUF1801 domain-containing protein n=1 Tax=uncultured Roseobacter sp. TaxID=114847 RepID=UPI002637F7E2|nr:DUF1801 domain-containing protein [uncultured Roseobacter sp.]